MGVIGSLSTDRKVKFVRILRALGSDGTFCRAAGDSVREELCTAATSGAAGVAGVANNVSAGVATGSCEVVAVVAGVDVALVIPARGDGAETIPG